MENNPAPTTSSGSLRAALGPLLFLTSIFFTGFLARVCMAPLMPVIEADLGISHAQAGSFFLFVSLGYFITLMASGYISARITHRRTVMLSAIATGLALMLLAASESLDGLRVGLFMVGAAAGLYLPSGIASLTELVSSRNWGKALAVHELAPNVALVLAPVVAELLLDFLSWRGVLACLGGASLVLGVVYGLVGKGGGFGGQPPSPANLARLLRKPGAISLVFIFSLGVAASLGIYTMMPLFMVNEHGLDLTLTNYLVAASRVAGIGMSFLGGWAADRLGPATALRWILGLTGAFTVMLGLATGSWLLIPLFLQPAVAVCFFPPAFAALSQLSSAAERNLAVSAVVPLSFVIGGGLMPWGVGWMGQHHTFALGFILTGIIVLCGVFFTSRLGRED